MTTNTPQKVPPPTSQAGPVVIPTSSPVRTPTPIKDVKGIKLYSPEFYMYCGLGGILSCGLTHLMVTPLDLVKCNAQANPKEFPNFTTGFRSIYSGAAQKLGYNSGVAGLFKGWAPTLVGYSAQGLCKFGFYEFFKHEYAGFFSEANQYKYRDVIYLFASASAELIADVALCPFEAVKVRIQTNPNYAKGLSDGLPKFYAEQGLGGLYAGIVPLWARQVPYTIIKFMAFERIAEALFRMMPKPKSELSKPEQMGVVFTAGYLAGILCAVVSHPADTMVSKINKIKMEGSMSDKMKYIYSGNGTPENPGIGFKGLWSGLGTRIIMVGTLTGAQWFLYGAFKAAVGLPVPGGNAPAAENKKH